MWAKLGVILICWMIAAMADNAPTLANILAGQPTVEDSVAGPYPYGRPRFPNPDPRAYFDAGSQEAFRNEGMGDRLNDLRTTLPWALMGMRPGVASVSMRPFNPKAPEAPLPKQPEPAMSDNGWAQHLYEVALGRKRMLGDEVAQPGSGGKWGPLKSPLFWLLNAPLQYGIWKAWDGDGLVDEMTGPPKHSLDHPWQNLWNGLADLPSQLGRSGKTVGAARTAGVLSEDQSNEERKRIIDALVRQDMGNMGERQP